MDHFGVSLAQVSGEFIVGYDLGVDTTLNVQSTRPGVVTVVINNSLGQEFTFKTTGEKNWNMVDSPLFVKSFPVTAADV